MLLKISLGLAILVGLATLYVTHVQVGGKITQLNNDLTSTQGQLTQSQQNEQKLTADNKTLKTQLDTTTKSLADATNNLAQSKALAREQTDRANKASKELLDVTAARNQAQEELAAWRAFEMTPDQIRNNLGRLRVMERQNEVLTTDNTVMNRKVKGLEKELARYRGDVEPDPTLPAGTKGSVVAVDPKYDFVVINLGGNQGMVENAKLLVNRDGKFLGKVKITNVEPDRSIANVLPEWKTPGDEIMEGDQVIF
jgi:hypothetical protein